MTEYEKFLARIVARKNKDNNVKIKWFNIEKYKYIEIRYSSDKYTKGNYINLHFSDLFEQQFIDKENGL